ncbi:MAG: thioredoxin domain-containing protein [Gammaproteobacteria bacterium]|nr:thioredoxin domain-containing protein [Gammaproteobacteria bacterium]MYF01951.1 thioredoxin domain-containing protein [Gammaproteobacteria bacterium]MYI78227.1 thioredoxin domain-containing protein [Gammaproteobacteria bacterium]
MAKKKKQKQERSVEIVRWSILGTVGLIITAFVIYAVLYTLGVFDSAENYSTLADREVQTDHIEVVEFFSYECIHCQRLEQRLQQFEANLPENVSFSRIHVAFTGVQRLAKMHVALQLSNALEQNHDRIFQEAVKNNNTFSSLNRISNFLDGHGITKARFENLYQGDRVRSLVAQNVDKSREARILGTPSLLVANKYVIHPNDPPVMMQTLHQLIRDIREGNLPLPEDESSNEELEQTNEETVEDGDEQSESNDDATVPEQPPVENESDDESSEEADSLE